MSMTVIEHIPVGSGGVASIEFTSISGDYTDLLLIGSIRNDNANRHFTLEFNDFTTNFTSRELSGTGSAAGSSARTDSDVRGGTTASTYTSNTFSSFAITIPNYAGSSNKSFSIDAVAENNATTSLQYITAGLWSVTSAITALKLTSPSNFVQYSSATLYGITAGSDGTTTVS